MANFEVGSDVNNEVEEEISFVEHCLEKRVEGEDRGETGH